MDADTRAQLSFFMTGRRPGESLDAVDGLRLRPALFAGYRELSRLRYDFPLILVAERSNGPSVQSLSGLIDSALEKVAQGSDAERISKHVLRAEQEIRTLVSEGATGLFSALWDKAAAELAEDTDPSFQADLREARAVIKIDGAVADCDAELPARLLRHAWAVLQGQKAKAFRKELDRLVLKLSDILKADFEQSDEGRSADRLKATVGAPFADSFDFGSMSRMLTKALPKDAFAESRRTRIRALLDVLNSQQFFPDLSAGDGRNDATRPYSFLFESCAAALEAFRARMPELLALARAMEVAELEVDGRYSESRHDALFEQFGANGLDPQELARFPDALVLVHASHLRANEQAQLMEILSSDFPIKVLLQIDDILDVTARGDGLLATGTRSRQIASMAMGLNSVYVLQSSSSNLFKLREQLLRGLACRGPALFSIYTGAAAAESGLPPYLMAAAAAESRAFPSFTYDPSAGANWASRFSLEANSQADLDWPIQNLSYEDENHQRVSQDLAFTLADFIASDRRYAGHLARVPRSKWNGSLIAVDEALTRERKGLPDKVPALMMVDEANVLNKVIVDEGLIREARRCREMWHSLQELGGVHNSHAEKLLERERKAWEERMQQTVEAHGAPAPEAVVTPAAVAPPPAPSASTPEEPEPQRSPDEAYIETPRCSTCDECTQLNNKMFAYDKNKQAYIADINAGTYAQLVEAAESCQVAIIHPGKPRNPNEPGLAELLKRAEAFI